KKIKKDTLLVDLSSVKSETVKVLKEIKNPSIAFHFLFGPNITTVMHQKIVYTKIKENDLARKIVKLFDKAGAQIIKLEAYEHDKQMAYIQALTHFVNLSFAKLLIENKVDLQGEVSTPVFLSQLSALEKVVNQNPEMISQIQASNPNFKEI